MDKGEYKKSSICKEINNNDEKCLCCATLKTDGQEPDAKLTELGIQQAENLTKFFLDKDIDFIISSPFERAYRTIAPLAEHIGIEVVLDDRLAERFLSSKDHPDWRVCFARPTMI